MSISQFDSFRFGRRFVCGLLLATLLSELLVAVAGRRNVSTAPNPWPTSQETRKISGQEPPHLYKINLKSNEFFQVRVEQYSVDVVLKLRNSNAQELARIDSPNGTDGTETLSFVAVSPGSFMLEVSPLNKQGKGFYAIQGDSPRPAVPRDFLRIKIERTFDQAVTELANQGPNKQSLAKMETAWHGWQELGDEYMAQLTGARVESLKQLLKETEAREQLTKEQKVAFQRAGELTDQIEELAEKAAARSPETPVYIQKIETTSEQVLQIYKNLGYLQGEVACLFELGEIYEAQEDSKKALEQYDRTLDLFPAPKEPLTPAMKEYKGRILKNMGRLYRLANEQEQALKALSKGLELYGSDELDEVRASLLLNLAQTKEDLNDSTGAEQSFLQARNIFDRLRMRGDAGVVLNKLGLFYSKHHSPQAFEAFKKADGLLKTSNFKDRYIWNLISLSEEYSALKDFGNADKYSAQTEKELDDEGNEINPHVKIVICLNAGDLYMHYEKYANALKIYQRGLALLDSGTIWDRDRVKYTLLRRMSYAAMEMDNKKDANSYRDQAIQLALKSEDKDLNVDGKMTYGKIRLSSGKVNEAISAFASAQKDAMDQKNYDGVAEAAQQLGNAYSMLGDKEQAWSNFKVALLHVSIFGGDQELVKLSYDLMESSARLGQRRQAIFFGKQVVSLIQKYRRTIQILDPGTQRAFRTGTSDVYRELAILLIQERRFHEARQVVQLYQDEGFFDSLSTQNKSSASFTFTGRDGADLKEFETLRSRVSDFRTHFRRSTLGKSFIPVHDKGLDRDRLKKAVQDFEKAIDRKIADLPESTSGQNGSNDVTKEFSSNPSLTDPGSAGTAVIQTIVAEDSFYVLLATRNDVRAFSTKITADDLNKKAETFLKLIATPPDRHRVLLPKQMQSASASLHQLIFKSISTEDPNQTLESVLQKDGVEVLFWSLDGNLRSIPVSALYDPEKRQYLLQQYTNVVFTRTLPEHLSTESTPWKGGLCMASLEEQTGGLVALHQMEKALNTYCGRNIIRNRDFTSAKMVQSLAAQSSGSVVLIASHFLFEPGDAEHSALVMGLGKDYSLAQMRKTPQLFAGVELLILAACQTAAQMPSDTGLEAEGFAELAQSLGARSVIGTLWSIFPDGTAQLLIEFHRLHERNPAWSKAQTLRQAQLNLLNKRVVNKNVDLSDPHYWAPFVIYGDFQMGPHGMDNRSEDSNLNEDD